MELLPTQSVLDLAQDDQDRLSEYAVVTRYPGDYDSITLSEAEEALHIGRRLRRLYHKQLAADDE